MKGDSVISNMSQPDTTQFIPIAADWMRTAHHRSRKSRNSNERDQPPRTAVKFTAIAPTVTEHSQASAPRYPSSVAIARRWASMSCRMPDSAMVSISSIWARENAPCSAVPCTSMKSPSSVMTMLKSTEARLSSS